MRTSSRAWLTYVLLCAAGAATGTPLTAQQLIGYVSTRDADVTGAAEVTEGQAVLSVSSEVTAKDRTAPISLGRGGTVRVCQTTALHLAQGKSSSLAAPLLLTLDRGAIEIDMTANGSDMVMTPDLRFAVRAGGPLDLRIRVAGNGDTCVENRGSSAPTLAVSDQFGEAAYELLAGQHVLFEHGSLREVVDRETTPCGCPTGMSLADAALAPGAGLSGNGPKAAEHPFPAAVSAGLAPGGDVLSVPQAAGGEVHTQVTEKLSYNAPPNEAAATASPAAIPAASPTVAPPPAPKPLSHNPIRVVGRFFRRLFGGN
jgi:hypothetical protein